MVEKVPTMTNYGRQNKYINKYERKESFTPFHSYRDCIFTIEIANQQLTIITYMLHSFPLNNILIFFIDIVPSASITSSERKIQTGIFMKIYFICDIARSCFI